MIYELECADCTFTRAVEGDHRAVYDAIESHRSEMADFHLEHVVDFEARAD